MTQVNLKLTLKELTLLTSLASDQLFRREFIDPRMPGQKLNPGEIHMGKELIARLRSLQQSVPPRRTGPVRKVNAL